MAEAAWNATRTLELLKDRLLRLAGIERLPRGINAPRTGGLPSTGENGRGGDGDSLDVLLPDGMRTEQSEGTERLGFCREAVIAYRKSMKTSAGIQCCKSDLRLAAENEHP